MNKDNILSSTVEMYLMFQLYAVINLKGLITLHKNQKLSSIESFMHLLMKAIS